MGEQQQDLERKLLELQGDTDAIRALDLAKLDQSNRVLQEQIWAIQDAKDAADAADQLRRMHWASVGDSIMDEVNRIRGLTDAGGGGTFSSLMGQFNVATNALRARMQAIQDAATSLPGLSQALLQAAELAATSEAGAGPHSAQTAASLAETYAAIMARNSGTSTAGVAAGAGAPTGTILSNAAAAVQLSAPPTSANDNLTQEIKSLREEVAQLRSDNNAGHAATAGKPYRRD
ncbi:MAG: hypothetical protein U5M50_00980 [Sphingobium sp.]|nr:hypothetical protein [Sphingobium sp.]